MTGSLFMVLSTGADAGAAFAAARGRALAGLRAPVARPTGTVADKDCFVLIDDAPEAVLRRAAAFTPGGAADEWHVARLPALVARLGANPANRRLVAPILLIIGDPRINEPRGPAGCVRLGGDGYLFFGWAPW